MKKIISRLKPWQKILTLLIVVTTLIGIPVMALSKSSTITFSGDQTIYLEYGQKFNSNTYRIYIDGKLTNEKLVTDLSKINYNKLGEYQITFQYLNKKGKTLYEEVRTLIIRDTKKPSITLLGDWTMTITKGQTFNDPGYEIKDNYDSAEALNVEITGEVDITKEAEYTITYKVSDTSGNTVTDTRIVNVVPPSATIKIATGKLPSSGKTIGNKELPPKDKPSIPEESLPTLQLIGDTLIHLEYLTFYEEPGYIATDINDGDITDNVIVTGLVNENELGTYEIIYTIVNSQGKTIEVTRTVIVEDTTPPEIILNGENIIELEIGAEYIEEGASALDNYNGEINVTIFGEVISDIPGEYIITYTATDENGNETQIHRTIIIFDPQQPEENPEEENLENNEDFNIELSNF